ncbi:MAG: hypothetical protein AAB875_01130, partial [Patescibacteria group bacterium]
KNAKVVFDSKGVPELTVPGKELQEKYERIIELLLQGELQPEMPAAEGEQPAPPAPSIAFDPVLDDAEIALAIIQIWAATPKGMEIVQSQSPGFQNLRAYAEQAFQVKIAAQPQEPPPPPPDPQKMEIAQLQEENKRALAEIEAKSKEAQEQIEAATAKWLETHKAALDLEIQDRQHEHEKIQAESQQVHEEKQIKNQPKGASK